MIISKPWNELFVTCRSVASIHVRSLFQTSALLQTETEGLLDDDEEFRVIDLKKTSQKSVKKFQREEKPVLPPRYTRMPVDQDWASVWPGPRSFHPATVPLPMFQGNMSDGLPPVGKFANAELMKIPNFLHLTPPAVKKQTEALRKFCTAWPEGLETDEKIEQHFPLEVITSDYCHSAPKIRDPKARIVTVKFKVKALKLGKHSKDKFKRLCKDNYSEERDDVCIVADRCPVRKQNYEYAMYLITALYHEAWNFAEWEKEKSEVDMEYYDWDLNKSKQSYVQLKCWPGKPNPETVDFNTPEAIKYRNAVTDLFNKGEDVDTLAKYKEAVKDILGLS
nr:PREDICTED: 28S ribosomal protein S35, mitochondrial [Bemisia tabaci]